MVNAMEQANMEPVIIEDLVNFGEDRGLEKGHRAEARAMLHRVLAVRKLPLSPEQELRIDVCTDLATLHRWHDQAIVAQSADEALQ
jgi:hypothetical protein